MKRTINMAGSGNENSDKINLYDDTFFPKISDLIDELSDTEMRAIEAIVNKDPSERWSSVAGRVGITDRQLRNIRNNEKVQEACYRIAKALFKSDLPDVLKTLTRKAKAGEAWAVRLFLEVSGEIRTRNSKDLPYTSFNVVTNLQTDDMILRGVNEMTERLKELEKKPTEELAKELEQRLKLSSRGVEDTYKAVKERGC